MEPSVIDDRHAIGIAHDDVPRCAPGETLADVQAGLRSTAWELYAVVNDEGVLLGRLDAGALQPGDQTVAEAMEEGPQTVRVDEEIPSLTKRMDEASLDAVFVTDPDGRLLGVVTRADVEAASVHSGA